MTNEEFIKILSQYPKDAEIAIEYCNPESVRYFENDNLIVIN